MLWIRRFAAAVILCLVSGLFAEDVRLLPLGAPAPDFDLPSVGGERVQLEDFKDFPILVVIFTANHCPTAQAYEGRIQALASDYRDRGVAVVAIHSNDPGAVCPEELGYTDLGDSFEDIRLRAEERGMSYPVLYDGDTQETARAYGPQATPHVFIFDAERLLRYRGRVDDMEDPYREPSSRDARNAVDALLAGRPVPEPETRVFGCSIKWSSKREWRKTLDERWSLRPVTLDTVDTETLAALMANDTDSLRLVNVYATWCGPCAVEFPEFVTLQRMYGGRAFEMVSVSTDPPGQSEKVFQFLKSHHAAFRNVHAVIGDRDRLIETVDPEWSGALPHTLLVAPGGEIVYRHTGLIDPLELKKVIIGRLGRFFADD